MKTPTAFETKKKSSYTKRAEVKYVRIYIYDDPHKGWGDCGTYAYVLMDNDCFVEKIETSFGGKEWTRTLLTEKGSSQLKNIAGYDYYTMGWQIRTKEEYEKEIQALVEKLARMAV